MKEAVEIALDKETINKSEGVAVIGMEWWKQSKRNREGKKELKGKSKAVEKCAGVV